MTGASVAAKEHAIATKGAAGSTEVFVAKQKAAQTELKATATVAKGTSTAMKALSIAGNMIAMWAITEGIQLAAKLVDKLIVTTEELKEAADNAINELNNLQSETDSLNQELTTTRDRITELENKPSLSFIEQEELQKLRDASSELERQIELNKTLLNVQEGKTRDSALDYLNKQTQYEGYGGWDMSQVRNGNARYGTQNVGTIFQGNQLEVAQRQLQEYENIAKRKENVEKRITSFKIANPDETKYTQDQKDALTNLQLELQSYDSTLKALNDSLYDVIPNLDTYKNALNPDYDQSYIDFIDKLIDGYNQLFGDSSGTKTEKFDDIWNSDDFKTYKSELESLAKEGKLDASVLESNEQYKKLLEETGATAEQTAQHINSLVSAEQGIANPNETDILSFSDAWNSEDFENARKELLSLAEAGQLTPETLESTEEYKTLLEQTGLSAEEAAKKINSMTDASTQLQSMSEQISKMSDMLADKKNGTVASASDLAGFDVTVKGLESWDEFERVMGSTTSTMEECQAAANALATEWANNGNFLANLTEENKDYYIQQLKMMGVENAEIVVLKNLEKVEAQDFLAKKNLNVAAQDTYEGLIKEGEGAGIAKVALIDLIAQEQIFSNSSLSVSGKISELSALASAYLGTAAAAKFAASTSVSGMGSDSRYYTDSYVQDQWKNALPDYKVDFDIAPTGSSNYKPGGGSGGKDTKQTIDWIQRKLDVLQKKIDQTKAKFENLFTLKDKKSNLTKQIQLTKNLLTTTEKSANRYLKAANKVGLSDALKKKVENGAYDITEYGSETAEKIQKYQSYLDSYNDLIKQSEELKTTIRDYEKQIFDEIKTTFDNQIGHIDDKIDDLNNQISAVENKGFIADASYYNAQASVHEQILGKLESEKKKLREQLKEIEKQTPAWYEAVQSIQDVDNQIVETTNKISEMKKAINDVADTLSGNIIDSFHDLNDEADTLITLLGDNLSDDKLGNLTKDGIAALGLYNQQMNVSKASAENIQNEIQSIQDAINNGTYTKFIDSNGMERQFESIYQAKDRIKELQESYRSEIQSTYQYESKIVDLMKQKYQSELNYVKELIEQKKELLSAEQDLYQYSRDIKNQVDGINSIKKQLAALQGDTSLENKSRVQKLEKQLKDQQDDLKDKEYERYISDTQNMLDNLSAEYQQLIESVSKDRDTLLKEGNQLIASNGAQIQQTINETVSEYGYQMSETMTSATSQITSGLFGIKSVLDSIETYLKDRVVNTSGDGVGGGNIEDYTPAGQIKSVLENGSNKNPTSSLAKAVSEAFGVGLNRHEMAQISGLLGLGYKYEDFLDSSSKKAEAKNAVLEALVKEGYLKKSGGSYIRGYAKGGVISSFADAIRLNGDKVLVSANPGERILTADQNENFEKFTKALPSLVNLTDVIKPNVNVPTAIDRNIGGITYGGNNQINIELPNVTNYEDFMRKFQNDPKAEQLVQHMTASALNGSRLGKNTIRF